mmetsp:Transcript_5147/g.6650  ORF Transcript_5147/g.6650 Transcript_5147/m.6650 type:complete len:362 (+) Transcript_5147:69-1154(+)
MKSLATQLGLIGTLFSLILSVSAFSSSRLTSGRNTNNLIQRGSLSSEVSSSNDSLSENKHIFHVTSSMSSTRKAFLASIIASSAVASGFPVNVANADDESFESIASKAANIAKLVDDQEAAKTLDEEKQSQISDFRSAYDFSLPIAGDDVPFKELINQKFTTVEIPGKNEGETISKTETKVKAILVVNMKQDDPIARKDIPELISLAAKFGRSGEFVVICSPTDQGYYEADTSALIRLKLASEYGYGINPATIVTDKVNLLGSGAHPFWRYIEGTCRAPSGLGRIQGNFEKFLVDGKTGKPVRRYPRKYQPFDIAEDIDALMKGKKLPPPGANWKEEWRNSDKEAERDVYRFQKGLNVFDQ